MKAFVFFPWLILANLYALSQEPCKDIIHTIEGNKILFDCCIEEVIDGNIVVYLKEGKQDSIAAYAITRKGQYLELIKPFQPDLSPEQQVEYDPNLYKGHTYEYYEIKYNRAKGPQGYGTFSTILGGGLILTSLIIALSDMIECESPDETAPVLIVIGLVMFNTGMPCLIAGSIVKANNRKAMQIIQDQKGLAFGLNKYGIGLTYRF